MSIFNVSDSAGLTTALVNAQNGDTIQVAAGSYSLSPINGQVINTSITLIGRSNASSGTRPVITFSLRPDITALTINASNVTIKGLEIVHMSTFGSNDTCIGLGAGGIYTYPDNGTLTNENIVIDDCKISYSKFGVSSKAKSFTVSNCEIHSRATTTARAIAIYSQDGIVNITNNKYTSAGNAAIELVHNNFATNDGYINKRNGTVNFTGNDLSGVITTRRAIFFEAGADIGVAGDKYIYNISNNTVASTSDCLLLLQPSRADFTDFIDLITINGNTFNNGTASGSRNGLVRIASYVSTNTINTINNPPKFKIYNNTIQNAVLNMSTNPYNVDGKDLVILTGFTTRPANVDSLLDTTPPAPPTPPPAPTANQLLINGTNAQVSSSGSTTTIDSNVEIPINQVREVVVPAAGSSHTLDVSGQPSIIVKNIAGASGEFTATQTSNQIATFTFAPATGIVAYQDLQTGRVRVAFDTAKPATVSLLNGAIGYIYDQNGRKVTPDGAQLTLSKEGTLDIAIPSARVVLA